ncbi:daunorubicin resistance protein DrrA family ABC transporter ATP-binding protein [Paraliobacillus quinghaiensis]|uniref:Daunorubicin resistance protein DrrA family ABC transporter ATP-binding protein n=1 Tax=Paraliobacillus quinghaiensis TaxID=470815 RepID=A0A917TX24_9BACI|nr:ATP-binding cassette domain-containing protein [Paraliobacillus quinghaiensis]GGM41786.1 daunorubicin resistance protein DrrA family ABC transporter ATP-binding protein [Paraliobacillus quinghaiensis]
MGNIVEVKGLKKRYKDFEAVKGLDLEVAEGEIFGFLGPNGAGKSTTINMLSTITKPSEGVAKINGYDNVTEKNKVRESIGLIFQESTLDEKLTANENLMLHCKFYKVPKEKREERIQEVLQIVDLEDKRSNIVETFSGGMKRRLEIARGLLHYPRVLFLDEPTVGLDPQTRNHIWEYILKLKKKQGITIFLTTHYMDEAEICDRVAVMDGGQLIALDTPEQLKTNVGGDIIEVSTTDNINAKQKIEELYQTDVTESSEGKLSFQVQDGSAFLVEFVKNFDIPITTVNLRRPTLNDVFLHLTGREIREESVSQRDLMKRNMRRPH